MSAGETTRRHDRKTLVIESDADFIREISEFLDALGHPQRLMILRVIEKDPKEIRQIALETGMSYENTKKHLQRLLGTGLVRKEAGFGQQTSRGLFPVWKYVLTPDAVTAIIRTLGIFSTIGRSVSDSIVSSRLDEIRSAVTRSLTGGEAALVVISGPQDGLVFPLTTSPVSIGREDEIQIPRDKNRSSLILSSYHGSVTRISHPHAVIYHENDGWFIVDKGSTSGTAINANPAPPETPVPLHNGDMIELGRGATSAWIALVILVEEH